MLALIARSISRKIQLIFFLCAAVCTLDSRAAPQARTAPVAIPTQDLESLRETVREFLINQSAGLPGQVSVSVNTLNPKVKLAPCTAVEAFFPGGGRAWGRTSVGLRCNSPYPWTVYIQGNVSVNGDYLVAATSLNQGQTIGKHNVMFQRGDLTTLPPGIFTSYSQIVGRVARNTLSVGTVLKQEFAAMPTVIQQGQSVRIISVGNGFTITAEGKAQNSATAGQMVQARVTSGQMISGKANANGQIEVGAQ